MRELSDEEFQVLISEAMDELPQDYIKGLNNVAVVIADEPTEQQRWQLRLCDDQTLFGLYEGIPLTKRGAGYNLVLPDKITMFKRPIMAFSPNRIELKKQIKHTLWHEIAHFFGLGHNRIHEIESQWKY